MMRSFLACGFVVFSLTSTVGAAPAVDSLLCKRSDKTLDGAPIVVMDIESQDTASARSPDGTRAVKNRRDIDKGGFMIVDTTSGKVRIAHNRDRSYDCDLAVTDEGTANSVRWLGNDVVFAQGWLCEEFAAKPYLVTAKTGSFIGYLKLKGVSPEAVYHFAPLQGSLWAVSVYDHNVDTTNTVTVFDIKSAKIKSTKTADPATIAKLPDCATRH